jgi:hypothetical protein
VTELRPYQNAVIADLDRLWQGAARRRDADGQRQDRLGGRHYQGGARRGQARPCAGSHSGNYQADFPEAFASRDRKVVLRFPPERFKDWDDVTCAGHRGAAT